MKVCSLGGWNFLECWEGEVVRVFWVVIGSHEFIGMEKSIARSMLLISRLNGKAKHMWVFDALVESIVTCGCEV